MNFLLDTNIIIFHLRGKINLNELRKRKKAVFFVSEISILELFYGAEKSDNPRNSYQKISEFLSEVNILNIQNCYETYAKIKNQLFKSGKPLHNEFDLLIGITALVNHLILVTDNYKDFKNIDNLKTENWIER